jgi:hypothetical protein
VTYRPYRAHPLQDARSVMNDKSSDGVRYSTGTSMNNGLACAPVYSNGVGMIERFVAHPDKTAVTRTTHARAQSPKMRFSLRRDERVFISPGHSLTLYPILANCTRHERQSRSTQADRRAEPRQESAARRLRPFRSEHRSSMTENRSRVCFATVPSCIQ